MSIMLSSPSEIATQVAAKAKARRLSFNWSQRTLAERSGVSLPSLKQFEHTGKISFQALLKLAAVLGALEEFAALFPPRPYTDNRTLVEILGEKKRSRGRQ